MKLPVKITTTAALIVFLYAWLPAAGAQSASGTADLPPPTLSHPPGMYTEPFVLEITSSDPDVVIRFELDGSVPGPHSPIYDGPIGVHPKTAEGLRLAGIPTNPSGAPLSWRWRQPSGDVQRGMVVRAHAERTDGSASNVVTATYLFASNDAPDYHIPIIFIVTDSLSLFDHETGIYVPGRTHERFPSWSWYWGTGNYHNRGREWERPAHMTLIEPDGSIAVKQDVGIRIHGGGSRALPQKSLRIYARSEYGESNIRHAVLPDRPVTEFKRLILRNNGQNFTSGVFRDGVMHELARDLDLDRQGFRSAVVFINGEYWGIHNIRERLDKHYLAGHYGVDPDEVEILEYFGTPKEGSADHYLSLIEYVEEADFSDPAALGYVDTQMDVFNYATYFAANVYAQNADWPGNNIEFWRPARPDGRWRWLFFDLDAGMGGFVDSTFDMLEHVTAEDSDFYSNRPEATLLLRRLLTSDRFRDLFINTIADQLNTVFLPDRVVSVVDSLHAIVAPYMPEHVSRWQWPAQLSTWERHLDEMKSFGLERPSALRENVVDFFELPGTGEITVDVSDPNAGSVVVNSVDLAREGSPWTGTYFQDVPIRLVAKPTRGFRLSRWEIEGFFSLLGDAQPNSSVGDTLVLKVREDVTVRAVFEALVEPHALAETPYILNNWPPDALPGTYPPGMVFLQTANKDPELHEELEDIWRLSYDRDRRSRIAGLEDEGFAFINTSNPQEDNGGYLGAAVLALDLSDVEGVHVSWTGGTVRPNERKYGIRLQYRVGPEERFLDVTYPDGTPVEYLRNETAGHTHRFDPAMLPSRVNGKPYVELQWKYYYIDTGVSGPRAMLRINDITVVEQPAIPTLLYPHPEAENLVPDVTLAWDPPRAATSYRLQLSDDSAFGSVVVDTAGITTADFQVNGLKRGVRYYWRVRSENTLASSQWSDTGTFVTIPEDLTVAGNYPNPFKETTIIGFILPDVQHVRLEVFDVMGRVVQVLVDGELAPGEHEKQWDASDMGSGLYFFRLTTGGSTVTGPMMLTR